MHYFELSEYQSFKGEKMRITQNDNYSIFVLEYILRIVHDACLRTMCTCCKYDSNKRFNITY